MVESESEGLVLNSGFQNKHFITLCRSPGFTWTLINMLTTLPNTRDWPPYANDIITSTTFNFQSYVSFFRTLKLCCHTCFHYRSVFLFRLPLTAFQTQTAASMKKLPLASPNLNELSTVDHLIGYHLLRSALVEMTPLAGVQ